jgi:trigger factor
LEVLKVKVNKNSKKDFTVTLELEEEFSEIEKHFDVAFKEVSQDVEIKGFRKGKIPRDLFEKRFGKEVLIENASQKVMDEMYRAAIKEADIFPIDFPRDVDVKQLKEGQPFIFTLAVDVKPEVKLGKYKGLKAEKEEKIIGDDEIAKHLEQLKENYAEYVVVEDRAAKDEDILSYDSKAFIEETPVEKWTKVSSGAKLGAKSISEEFDKELIGLKINEAKDFELDFKADYADKEIAGNKVKFSILLHEIREKKLPELTDELVKKASSFEKVEDYKKDIKEKMQSYADEQSERTMKENLLQEVIKSVELKLPAAMTDKELDMMVRETEYSISQYKIKLEDYLKMQGKDLDSFRAEMRPKAEDRVKLDLILDAVFQKENIEISEEEIEAELTKQREEYEKNNKDGKELKVPEGMKDYIKAQLKEKKTIDFLIENAKITAKKAK